MDQLLTSSHNTTIIPINKNIHVTNYFHKNNEYLHLINKINYIQIHA